MPIISIIVPVYNVEKYLDRCIKSILDQTFTNFELLLINDGSTDSSGKICDMYAQKDNRIIVRHKKNQGVSVARNLGIDLSKGKYIVFIDSDDWIEKKYLEEMYSKVVEMKVSLLITGYVEDKNGVTKNPFKISQERIYDKKNIQLEFLKQEKFMWTIYDKFFSKDLIGDNRFDNKLKIAEDMYFFWNVLKKVDNVGYMPLYKYHYDISASATITSPFSLKWLGCIKVKKMIYNDCKSISLKHKFLAKMIYLGELGGIARKAILSSNYNTKRLIIYLQYKIRKNFLYCLLSPITRVITLRQRLGLIYFLFPYNLCCKWKSLLK